MLAERGAVLEVAKEEGGGNGNKKGFRECQMAVAVASVDHILANCGGGHT